MRSYTKPDMERPIEEIRAKIRRDYHALVALLQLPESLGFEAAVAATRIGMVPRDKYPFREFQQAFAEEVARHSGNDEAFIDAFEIVTGVWNYFPHSDLGMSPVEKMREEMVAGEPPLNYDALCEELTSDTYAEKMHQATDARLEFLSGVAQSHLSRHLLHIGGTKKDVKAIVAIFADPHSDPNDALKYLLIDMTHARKAKKKLKQVTIEDVQPTVRAITMCENHIASIMDNGHMNSRMFQNIARQCMAHMTEALGKDQRMGKRAGSVEIIEPLGALDMLLDIHAGVSELAGRLHIPEGLEEAAHHILDWLTLTDIHDILGRDPKESAALMLAVARFIAASGDPKQSFAALAPRLRAAAIDFTDDDYDKEVARLAEKAIVNCGDPVQMMPVPGQESDDCMERLAKIAPGIKFPSPISPDDLPTPSPFM